MSIIITKLTVVHRSTTSFKNLNNWRTVQSFEAYFLQYQFVSALILFRQKFRESNTYPNHEVAVNSGTHHGTHAVVVLAAGHELVVAALLDGHLHVAFHHGIVVATFLSQFEANVFFHAFALKAHSIDWTMILNFKGHAIILHGRNLVGRHT